MRCMSPPTNTHRISLLVVIVSLSLYSLPVFPCKTTPSLIPKSQRGRIFFFSNKQPLTSVLGANETYVNSTALLLRHFENVDEYIAKKTNSLVCPDNTRWSNAAQWVAKTNGWDATVPPCVSNLFHVPRASSSKSQYSVDDLYDALVKRVEVGRGLGGSVKKALKNWTDVQITFRGNDSVVLHNIGCSLYFTLGYRIDERWYMAVSYSTHPQNYWVPDWKRQIVIEYTRVDGGDDDDGSKLRLVPMNLTLPVNPPENATNQTHCVRDDATTRWTFRSGASSVSGFYGIPADKIEVIPDALEKAQITIHHANDALYWSNIAIISLPLVLNLVPVSLVSNVKSRRVFMYVVITRVFAALPMLIKGVEIIVISQRKFTSILTRTGVGKSKQDVVAAELWIAKCEVKDNIAVKGVYFILTAMLSVLLGLLFELFALRYAKKKYVDFMFLHGVTPHIRSEHFRNALLKDMDLEYEMSDSDGRASDG